MVDGLIPLGKTEKYITIIEVFVDHSMEDVIERFKEKELDEKGCLTTEPLYTLYKVLLNKVEMR